VPIVVVVLVSGLIEIVVESWSPVVDVVDGG
jgi:hypothetical protein